MHNVCKFAASFTTAVALSGCAAPFADRIAYDTEIRNAPGTITLSDPKLYTREALISERARDVKWINGLIANSEDPTKVVFKPELVREVEQITTMAAAIGLKFDPAAELAYRRDKETNGIQHEIDVMKLQLQLDQLKRDADLVRANFDSQTASANENINQLSNTSAQSSTTITASAVDQLKTSIDKLNTTLTSRLDADGKMAATTTVTSSPFNDFRDRSSYRDMLKAAQNAAGLDQLHDYGNARLIRLNFQASILPDSDNLQSLGAIKAHVVAPSSESPATIQFLRNWLEYLNTHKDYRSVEKLNIQDGTIQELLLSSLFDKVDIFDIEVLLPVLIDGDGRPQSPSNIYRRSGWMTSSHIEQKNYQDAISKLSSIDTLNTAETLRNICSGKLTDNSDLIERRIQEAADRELSGEYIQLANTAALSIGRSTILTDEIVSKLNNAHEFLEQVRELMSKLPQCKAYSERLALPLHWKSLSREKIRVYEIGPREQVQQVSTVARSASSLALAASLAASDPSAGIGAEAAASYSRQTLGRATALERVPSVIGYSQAGDSSFGWVFGPHAVLNVKGHIDMAQLLKTYDLSVDMAVPGWWPVLDLEVTTVWAPSPALIASGKLTSNERNTNRVTVPLIRNSADEFGLLTQYLLGQDSRVTISNIQGGPVNACDKSNLLITGTNLWRAKQVVVLGQALGEEAITITADMKGILLSVPAITPLLNGNFSKALYVITPLGMSEPKDVEYISEPSGDSCKPKKAQADEAPKDAVSVSEVKPLEFVVPSPVNINVKGTNLEKVVAVQLDGQPASSLQVSTDKKSLLIIFDENKIKSVRGSDNTSLEFFENDKTTGKPATKASVTKYIRTSRGK
jgi:hypothetical protein